MLALEYFNLMAPSLISPQKGYIITLPNYTAWQINTLPGRHGARVKSMVFS
jgi:hypothetical protein